MSEYQTYQDQRATDLSFKVVTALRDTADRIERETQRPPGAYNNRLTRAADIVHEIHSMLANLPLWNLIETAHEASPRAEENNN